VIVLVIRFMPTGIAGLIQQSSLASRLKSQRK